MRCVYLAVLFSFVLITAPAALAQRPGGGGNGGGGFGGTALLGQKSVQTELKLSDEQVKKVNEFVAKQRETFAGLRDASREERRAKFEENRKASEAAVDSILDGEQRTRFGQIVLQLRGADALGDPEIAGKVGLDAEQKKNVDGLISSAREEMRSLFRQGGGGGGGADREAAREKLATLRTNLREKALGVLTPEQQAKWKELTGAPFEGEIRSPFDRGRQRGRDN
jgi:Spy/CpxP family protein refolding chaperone